MAKHPNRHGVAAKEWFEHSVEDIETARKSTECRHDEAQAITDKAWAANRRSVHNEARSRVQSATIRTKHRYERIQVLVMVSKLPPR